MQRREYIALGGAALSISATGCLGNSGGDGEPTPTETDTPTPREPPVTPPEITNAGFVTEWDEYGDLAENKIRLLARSDEVYPFAYHFDDYVSTGRMATTTQIELYDADGIRLAQRKYSEERLVEENGEYGFENAVEFAIRDYEYGEYSGEVIIRNRDTEMTSNAYEFEFEVVDA